MRAVAEFDCEATAVSAARAFVREQLSGADESLVESALLLTSELATNAVVHAKTPYSVSVEHQADHVRIEVGDLGDGGFQVQHGKAGPGGHGLFVVRAMASRSGFESRGDRHVAWFELEVAAPRDEDGSLSRELARLSDAKDLDELLSAAVDGAIALVGADFGTVQLRDPSTESLRIVAHRGFDEDFLRHFAVVDDDASVCGRALAAQAQVMVPDVAADAGFAPHRAVAARSGFRAVQSTPVLHGDRLLGMISTHFGEVRDLSDAELALLRRFALAVGECLAGFDVARRARATADQGP